MARDVIDVFDAVAAGEEVTFGAINVTNGGKVLAGVEGKLILVYQADANKALTPTISKGIGMNSGIGNLVLPKSEDGAVVVAGPFETERFEQTDGYIYVDYAAGNVGGILAIRIP